MERPGDDYKETHNVTFQPRDSLFGGQVSRLQVAEVVGATVARSNLAENKVRCRRCFPLGGATFSCSKILAAGIHGCSRRRRRHSHACSLQ